MQFSKRSLLAAARKWIARASSLTVVALDLLPLHAQRVVRQLREAGATSPQRAKPYRAQSALEEDAFVRLQRDRVIREPTPGRYYLDERALEALLSRSISGPPDDDVKPLS